MTASVTPLAEADRIFSKTLSLKKQRIEVLNVLVQVYERLGQWQNAMRYTREEIKLRDENENDTRRYRPEGGPEQGQLVLLF